MVKPDRVCDTNRFYELLARLEIKVGGKAMLKDCDGQEGWPRGVYFFFEHGETRTDKEGDLRVVRVGTHGTKPNSPSKLWWRLTQHKSDVGRSVFRDHIERALLNRSGEKKQTHNHQSCVSQYIGFMPFLWVKVDGEDGHLRREEIERNSIALLSFWRSDAIGQPSKNWLGKSRGHRHKKIERSGLWNVNYVTRGYDPAFLDTLQSSVEGTTPLVRRNSNWDQPACLNQSESNS